MSFVIASPEALLAAATDLAAIRSTIRAANAAAAVPTTGALAPAADEVSAGHSGAIWRPGPELSSGQRPGGGVS
ncbi:PE family protein [Mycobacterium tuberculosis]|nr:PE family protein [Mycobacterium tuberculosis]CNZ06258.1 PE family protein [Mycobacterium tuberculosis]COW07336.1 PE family protein [Mycobacterium tuberculosis]